MILIPWITAETCCMHKAAQNALLLLCGKVFWISDFKTLFFKNSLKLRRLMQDFLISQA